MTDEAFLLKANSTTDATDDVGEYTLKFEVTAFQEDFYFNKTAARGTTGTTEGAEYTIERGGSATTTGVATESLTSTADTEGSRFVVHEGETETFTLKVNFNPATSGFYSVQLNNVNYFMASTGGTSASQIAQPEEDFDTDESNI